MKNNERRKEGKKARRRKEGGHAFLMDPTLRDGQWGETLPREQPNGQTGREQMPSGHPESNQGLSDHCSILQSDALPAELWPACFK